MAQSSIFSQVVNLIPRSKFESWVSHFGSDKNCRTLNSWTWFGALLFGQLSGNDSIRAIERLFSHDNKEMERLGFSPVKKSTLADANHKRSVGVLEETYKYCLNLANQFCTRKKKFKFKGKVFALDSTTIELCLSICPWAQFHHSKGAIKLHTAIDVASDLPQFAVISNGRTADIKAARQYIHFKAGSMVVFDRGYLDYNWLNELTRNGIFFVTRAKSNMRFKVVESRKTDRTRGHICDQEIYLKSVAGQKYEGTLRRISFRDPDTGKKLTFLTNRKDLATQTICDLYKARWSVELFFKAMKQNLKIKKFLGTSANAVKSQVLVALIAYLLVQIIRSGVNTNITIPETMAVLGVLLLLKQPLHRVLGQLPRVVRHPPEFQTGWLF